MEHLETQEAALLERCLYAVDTDLTAYLGMRLGFHPVMLAMGVAGATVNGMDTAYRAVLARTLRERGPDAVDTSLPHLVRETVDGRDTVRVNQDAYDVRGAIHALQVAARDVVRDAATVEPLAETVLRDVAACVLDDMLGASSAGALAVLDDDTFRATFRATARASERCTGTMSPAALAFARDLAADALRRADLLRYDLPDLERMLGLRPLDPDSAARLLSRPFPAGAPPAPAPFRDGVGIVPANHATWALQQAIRDAALARGWSDARRMEAPAHVTPTNKGRGEVRVSVRPAHGDTAVAPADLPRLWEQVRALDDLTSDALLVCLAHWTAADAQPDTPVWVTADAILDARGIQRIRRAGEPRSWQHGHRREDRLAAGRALAQLDDLWLQIVDVEVIPGRRGHAPRAVSAESRALAILDRMVGLDDDGHRVFLAARVVPGDWLRAYWDGGLRQTGQIAQQSLRYDPYRERPEKWLSKYLAFQFRWNARRRSRVLRRRVGTLIEQSALNAAAARPQRARDRLEKALSRLAADGVIDGWRYEQDPGLLPARHWHEAWTAMLIQIDAPAHSRTARSLPAR